MNAIEQMPPSLAKAPVCRALNVPRASFYRRRRKASLIVTGAAKPCVVKPAHIRALAPQERDQVIETLNSPRFVDQAPAQIYSALIDEGIVLCSVRTMYRILAAEKESRERRNQLRHPNYKKPELLATAPNQVWSWDITKLLGPTKWTYYYLYVLLDIFSRYVTGWLLAECESAQLAAHLIREALERQGVEEGQLTIHSDRGASMTSKTVAHLLADLGVTKSLSRPYVSNDNPYSESLFKTTKHRPDFPERFGSPQDGRTFCRPFFGWYNNEHYHSGLNYLTPYSVHYGKAPQIIDARHATMMKAYELHPERFVKHPPKRIILPTAAWINPPKSEAGSITAVH